MGTVTVLGRPMPPLYFYSTTDERGWIHGESRSQNRTPEVIIFRSRSSATEQNHFGLVGTARARTSGFLISYDSMSKPGASLTTENVVYTAAKLCVGYLGFLPFVNLSQALSAGACESHLPLMSQRQAKDQGLRVPVRSTKTTSLLLVVACDLLA